MSDNLDYVQVRKPASVVLFRGPDRRRAWSREDKFRFQLAFDFVGDRDQEDQPGKYGRTPADLLGDIAWWNDF